MDPETNEPFGALGASAFLAVKAPYSRWPPSDAVERGEWVHPDRKAVGGAPILAEDPASTPSRNAPLRSAAPLPLRPLR